MGVLAVAKDAPTAFSSIVGWFPCRIPKEGAEPHEVIRIQIPLLATQRRELRRFRISTPAMEAPLRLLRRSSVAQFVFPDRKPVFQEGTRHPQLGTGRSG